jgi:predicted DNA binding protein
MSPSLHWRQPYLITLQIENKYCKIKRMLHEKGIQNFSYMDLRASSKGSVNHLVQLPENQVSKIVGRRDRIEGNSAWIESKGCRTCNTILAHGAFLVSGRSLEDSTTIFNFLAPSLSAYKKMTYSLDRMGLKAKVIRLEMVRGNKKILTDKQEKALWLASRRGFFNYPRTINPDELARRLKISPSTLSEILRRGLRRLVEEYFKAD